MKTLLARAGERLGMGRFRSFRRFAGGDWFLVRCVRLGTGDFWSRTQVVSCNAQALEMESYGTSSGTK